ncbi:MAG: carboxypeptidase-like regulatory domain-containing protein, partial [Gemmatimonadaceae bacterium]
MSSRFAFIGCLLLFAPASLSAQRLTGTVLRGDPAVAAVGVLVEVRTSSRSAAAAAPQAAAARPPQRTFTDSRGAFRLNLPAGSDSVFIRVLRPGYRPHVVPPLRVADALARPLRITLGEQPVTIAQVEVRESRICGPRAESAAWQLWESARTVLQSIELTERDTSIRIWTVEFQGEATEQGTVEVRDSTIKHISNIPPLPPAYYDSLYKFGYIRRNADTTVYYAPNATVLADEYFIDNYCFRVAPTDSTPNGSIGVRFEPMRIPRVTDIAGTFWLDAESYLLQRIEFDYVNAPATHRMPGTGGDVLFAKLPSGHWILSEWSTRMARSVLTREPPRRTVRVQNGSTFQNRGRPLAASYPLRWSKDLWARNQVVYRVQQDETTL